MTYAAVREADVFQKTKRFASLLETYHRSHWHGLDKSMP